MVDPKDAEGITVPMCMLASKDEDKDAVKKFEEALKVEKHVETFGDQVHGWMAARCVISPYFVFLFVFWCGFCPWWDGDWGVVCGKVCGFANDIYCIGPILTTKG